MIDFDKQQVKELTAALETAAKRVPIELKIAVNATARKAVSSPQEKKGFVQEIRKEVTAKVGDIKSKVKITAKATTTNASATVTVPESARLGINKFARTVQNKRGVASTVSRKKGRTTVLGGFRGPTVDRMLVKWKGNAFKRTGKTRLPIVKLHGPSPWGVVKKNNLDVKVAFDSGGELVKQIDRRIRYHVLKRSGLI